MAEYSIRASDADLIFRCGESCRVTIDGRDVVAFTSDSEAARLGTAVHILLGQMVRPSPAGGETLEDVAERHEVPVDELRFLFARGRDCWDTVSEHMAEAQVEVPMQHEAEGLRLEGTADVVSVRGDDVLVLDWKSGRIDSGYENQLLAYGWLALKTWPGVQEVVLMSAYLRHGRVDVKRVTSTELERWWARLRKHVRDSRGKYSPGEWCQWCGRRSDCPGRRTYLGDQMLVLLDDRRDQPAIARLHESPLTPSTAASLGPSFKATLEAVETIRAYGDELREILRRYIEEHGSVPTGDGREYRLEPSSREVIDPRSAWPHVQAVIGDSGLAECTKILKTKMKAKVFDVTARGSKGFVWDKLMTSLREAGAVTEERMPDRLVHKEQQRD